MKSLIFKLTRLTIINLCLLIKIALSLVNTNSDLLNGHIETIGDMLIANSDDSNVNILSVSLGKYHLSGCDEPICEYDLCDIPNGIYMATVYTNNGSFFQTITVSK